MRTPIEKGLHDLDPYVKKTAIVGCIKYFYLNKSEFKKTEFMDHLQRLMQDNDPLVVMNAIEAINEIYGTKGGIDINRDLVIPLLNRIKDFNEWG
mmetsp:Transcript_1029/g.675  ORF Transcript_1029/g.675 Transcript_1029/m.675 type:complete len:95 (+) Transcript_1029:464-748(+)